MITEEKLIESVFESDCNDERCDWWNNDGDRFEDKYSDSDHYLATVGYNWLM